MLLLLLLPLLVTDMLAQPPITSLAVTRKQGGVDRWAHLLSMLFLFLLILLLMPILLLHYSSVGLTGPWCPPPSGRTHSYPILVVTTPSCLAWNIISIINPFKHCDNRAKIQNCT